MTTGLDGQALHISRLLHSIHHGADEVRNNNLSLSPLGRGRESVLSSSVMQGLKKRFANTAGITHFNEGYGELLYRNLLLSGVPLIKPSSFRTFSKNLKYVNKILRNGISDHNEAKSTKCCRPPDYQCIL